MILGNTNIFIGLRNLFIGRMYPIFFVCNEYVIFTKITPIFLMIRKKLSRSPPIYGVLT